MEERMTRFEFSSLVGARAAALADGEEQPYDPNDIGKDFIVVAEKEIRQKLIPAFVVREGRRIPLDRFKYMPE